MDWDTICYNAGAFIAGLFLLEYGAETFLDHTAILARQLGVSPTLIALLTAGAEWEELAVVIAALAQHHPSLAIGNIVGSCISNILGAFSLGLLFHSGSVIFDPSSKIYTGILFLLTTLFALSAFLSLFTPAVGILALVVFAIYIIGVSVGIYRGQLTAPEDSDSDSSSEIESTVEEPTAHESSETSALLPDQSFPRHRSSVVSHIVRLLLGLLALTLSAYVLSHSASTLSAAIGISETVAGLTILSFATTLPEKLVAVLSGTRGHTGILVANTVGSNIFLLTLCGGIVVLGGGEVGVDGGELRVGELIWLWGSVAALTVVVLFGVGEGHSKALRVLAGISMGMAYLIFLALEFTVLRK